MAAPIADALRRAHADIDLLVEEDTGADPPQRDEIEVLIANRIPQGLLQRMPRLRWLQLTGVGSDHLKGELPARPIAMSHSGDVPATAVAEFVWMGLLAIAKDTKRLLEQQRAEEWRLPDARRVAGTRLLMIGTGRIGQRVAARARAFEVEVVGVNRSGAHAAAFSRVVAESALDDELPRADFVVLAVPSTADTAGLVDARRVSLLPAHAGVVNVSRADVLDEDAVVAALRAGRLRGAVLDVHREEPLPKGHDNWRVPGLVVTPHCAYFFPEEAFEVGQLCADNLSRFLEGRPLLHAFDAPDGA